jgi:AraC-like DNA-binding protein
MQRALELLRDPDLSITEIAGRVGFGNVSHFARSLRKATGRGPRELHAKRGAAGHGA